MEPTENPLSLQPPLSRRGRGPGLILLLDPTQPYHGGPKTLDPPPLQKWAEEGYAVAQVLFLASAPAAQLASQIAQAAEALRRLEGWQGGGKGEGEREGEGFGVVSYLPSLGADAAAAIDGGVDVSAVVAYGEVAAPEGAFAPARPWLLHVAVAGDERGDPARAERAGNVKRYEYLGVGDGFVLPGHEAYSAAPAGLAHTRCLTFLKPVLGGPFFDLEAVWDEHTRFEFGERDVEKTMATMVAEPYVNHVPTLTGGVGRERLTKFYREHFIFSNPEDTRLELVSRTVGIDRIIDEFVFHCTHDRMIDWLVPGVPPTGRRLSIPFTSVVNVRGDRLFHEHIAWDQATALVQLGLMPQYLPFPYPLPGGRAPAEGKRFEVRVPAAGVESARKLLDESEVESNGMFKYELREVDIVGGEIEGRW